MEKICNAYIVYTKLWGESNLAPFFRLGLIFSALIDWIVNRNIQILIINMRRFHEFSQELC